MIKRMPWILLSILVVTIVAFLIPICTVIPEQSQQIGTLTTLIKSRNAEYDTLQSSYTDLETKFRNCQSANIQTKIGQILPEAIHAVKEPAPDDWETYIYEDPCGSIPPKYIEWKFNDIQCGTARTDKSRQTLPFCMITSTITNNHPTLSIVDISINDVTIASANPCATRIDSNQNCTSIKSVELAGYISQKLILKWRWQ